MDEKQYEVDWDELFHVCNYAMQQLYVAAIKEADAPCSAHTHRQMAYKRLLEAMKEG
jgi:hypothetical protein